ncbi:MAG: phytanoyl-CoA dioxygenase family protein [Planctomycetota bacterium]
MKTVLLRDQLEANGFVLPKGLIDSSLLDALDQTFTKFDRQAGRRDLLSAEPITQRLLRDPFLCQLVDGLFDRQAFVVRATLFDKQPNANWSVTWHQDQAIAVSDRHDCPGFGPWSIKNGVQHVEPPRDVLERMTAIRLHLEDCTEAHGPLIISPKTHLLGRLTGDKISQVVRDYGEEVVTINAGSVLVMKPLTLHRSLKMAEGKRRRAIHLDCTDQALPEPLAWKYNAGFGH